MDNNKKKILVINLTRMGDILQTTPLLQALKDKNPKAEISYLAVSGYAEICNQIPEIDKLIPFDFNSAVAVSKEAIRYLPRRINELDAFIKALQDEDFDEVINVSHSRISALLTHLIDVETTRGITLSSEGYRLIRHPWARYFFIANLNRHYNRINLVDINLGLSMDNGEFAGSSDGTLHHFGRYGLSYSIDTDANCRADELLTGWQGGGATLKIGFQPGASLDCKRWPTTSFAKLGEMLQEQFGASILVFGTQPEEKLAVEVTESLGKAAINLAGKTDISTLGAILGKLDLLITNDTGTQHLAAAVGTPVVSLCFGSALAHETGPYGEVHVVMESTLTCFPCSFHVQCNDFHCQEVVTPEAVFSVAKMMLESDSWNDLKLEDAPLYQDVNIWHTGFEVDGFWHLCPLITRPLKASDAISLCNRIVWKQNLTSKDELIDGRMILDSKSLKEILRDYAPPDMDSFEKELEEPLAVLKRLEALATEGQRLCHNLKIAALETQPKLDVIKAIGDEIHKIDEELAITGFRLPAINQLIVDFTFRKHNLEDNEVGMLAAKTGTIYKRLQINAANLRYTLENLLEMFSELGWPTAKRSKQPDALPSEFSHFIKATESEKVVSELSEAVS